MCLRRDLSLNTRPYQFFSLFTLVPAVCCRTSKHSFCFHRKYIDHNQIHESTDLRSANSENELTALLLIIQVTWSQLCLRAYPPPVINTKTYNHMQQLSVKRPFKPPPFLLLLPFPTATVNQNATYHLNSRQTENISHDRHTPQKPHDHRKKVTKQVNKSKGLSRHAHDRHAQQHQRHARKEKR